MLYNIVDKYSKLMHTIYLYSYILLLIHNSVGFLSGHHKQEFICWVLCICLHSAKKITVLFLNQTENKYEIPVCSGTDILIIFVCLWAEVSVKL